MTCTELPNANRRCAANDLSMHAQLKQQVNKLSELVAVVPGPVHFVIRSASVVQRNCDKRKLFSVTCVRPLRTCVLIQDSNCDAGLVFLCRFKRISESTRRVYTFVYLALDKHGIRARQRGGLSRTERVQPLSECNQLTAHTESRLLRPARERFGGRCSAPAATSAAQNSSSPRSVRSSS